MTTDNAAKAHEIVPLNMQLPAGAFMTSDHRYYFNGDGPAPSVTTVLDIMSKPALITWKAKESARALYNLHLKAPEWDMPEEELINWAVKESDKARDTAARLGSSVHLLADMASRGSEIDSKTFEVSEQERPYLAAWKGFTGFLEAQGGKIISSEKIVWSYAGYAGTYDLLVQMDGELWLLDIKTSKQGDYPEYGLQLAAYGYADIIILPGNPTPYPMPKVTRYGVLHLRPDKYVEGWRLIEYPVTDKDYVAFLGALEVFRWRKEGRFSRSILNKPRSTSNNNQESPAINNLSQE